ncbi:SDR family NAD(P)-dependent oxidoreductase [Rhodococcus sp. NPDC060086]|uniref:SDR family NAD(P)-dependent oxidoreductase n=1 Tax=unclassified Rhodococcus (in: high G+C Gram-positive bacteria) TaxID=192944 RepID=UPI00365337B4
MKTAVVTGGSSGIGKAIAERLRKDGHQVAVFDLNPSGGELEYKVDVSDPEQVGAAFAQVREELGPVTILVNGAGLELYKRFKNIDYATWQKVVDVNLGGVFHCVQSALPDMIDAGWGRIVNISSSSAQSGQQFMSAYVSAKAAVNGLTKSLALEYGPDGITVNAVPPGFVDTPMLRRSESKGLLGGTIEDHIQRTPVRRAGRPEDIAAACAFLISEEAGYITGQILGVNGGRNT